MTAATLLSELRRAGVHLSVTNAGNIHFKAPAGILTPDLKDLMRRHKPELIRLLSKPTPAAPRPRTVHIAPDAAPADLQAVDDLFGPTPGLPWHRLVEALKEWRRDEEPDEYARLEREAIEQESM